MPKKFVTQRELAACLDLSARRVRQLERAGILDSTGDGDCRYDLAECERRYNAFVDRNLDLVETELMRLAGEIDAVLGEMSSTSNQERRLRIAKKFGRPFAQYGGWMRLSTALAPQHQQPFFRDWAEMQVATIGRAAMDLMGVKLAAAAGGE